MDFLNKIHNSWKIVSNRNRKCMYSSCSSKAIKSHVLQKNGILRQISEKNHLIELKRTNAFEIQDKGILDFKKIGINNVYTFEGFCNQHDPEIFRPIENNEELDLENTKQQALFSYRGLCQEIRRKEISNEMINMMINEMPSHTKPLARSMSDGYIEGLKNLNYFRQELESALKQNDLKSFSFSTVKIPKIDLCISVPLNIGEFENPEGLPYEEWKNSLVIPFTTSFINVFPYKQYSYFITGYHRQYPCNWTDQIVKRLKNSNPKQTLKELSDLIVLRLEFWAMSPELFSKIPNESLEKYKEIFLDNVLNHSGKLKTNFNLFEQL